MASVSSSTSSLGNTSLKGYGGLVSGIDRDSIIEQMTSGTQAKITKQKQKIEKLTWKQEAYRNISSQILELQDNYFSYSSSTSLKDASVFAKNQITVQGDSDITKFVSASGESSMVDHLSILGVKQLASSTTLLSATKGASGIKTNITADSLSKQDYEISNLKGTKLEFGTYDSTNGNKFIKSGTFTFPATYTDDDGNKIEIDYTGDGKKLAEDLNKAFEQSAIKDKANDEYLSDLVEFQYVEDENGEGKIQLVEKEGKSTNLVINSASSALKALGYDSTVKGDDLTDGVSLEELKKGQKNFKDASVSKQNMVELLKGQGFSISLGGQTKKIKLVETTDNISSLNNENDQTSLKNTMQKHIDEAFGEGKIKVGVEEDGKLSFDLVGGTSSSQTLTISTDDNDVRKALGLQKSASTKLSTQDTIENNLDKLISRKDGESDEAWKKRKDKFLDELNDGLYINNVKIEGVTKDTTISDMMDKINANTKVGVKASYISGLNQFVLVASETGAGREITLDGASLTLFGAKTTVVDNDGNDVYVDSRLTYKDNNNNVVTIDESKLNGSVETGQDAQILVSYGNNITTLLESSSNSFDLEGMKVTVKGEFGNVEKNENGTYTSDKSKAVTFSASADVDGITEKVKKFFEEYNALVTEVNKQVTTKPASGYDPLTEDQKDEMSETSIENWEKKAKEGLLYNDSIMRELSMDLQSVITGMLESGMSYEDLEEMGITMSDDYYDGGTITFDEAKFKAALTEDPDKVSKVFTGGSGIKKGIPEILEGTLQKYATRYKASTGSYGLLIEEAGSEKVPLSVTDNEIYRQLKDMQEVLEKFKTQLETEQDRYIQQFTTMETLISQMNAQSSYLSQLQG